MPIAFDANLTSTPAYATGASTTLSFVTSAAAAAGSKIFLALSYFDAGNISFFDITGTALTWGVGSSGSNGSDNLQILVADAPSGLASGTTITITFENDLAAPFAVNARAAAACSFTGLFTGIAPDKFSFSTVGTTSWTAGTVTTTVADSLIFGVGMVDGSVPTWTPASGFTEAHDWAGATDNEAWETVYKIVSATGSYSAGGTGGSGAFCGTQVAFSGSAGAPSATYIASLGRRPVPMIKGPDRDRIMKMWR